MPLAIRRASQKDFADVLYLIKLFESEGFEKYGIKTNAAYLLKNMPLFLPTSLVLEANGRVVGVMAGVEAINPVNGQKWFQQAFWYVQKEYRSNSDRLLEATEGFVKNVLKINTLIMCSHGDERRETKDRYFRRKGFSVLETHYIKTIGGNDA